MMQSRGIWGPAIDPAPEWPGATVTVEELLRGLQTRGGLEELLRRLQAGGITGGVWGPAADPAPPYELLDKAKVAKIMVRKLDMRIAEVQNQLDLLKLERDLLVEEHQLE
jgi:hypothetical protein